MLINDHDGLKNFIIGITLRQYDGEKGLFLRFARIYGQLTETEEMMKALQNPKSETLDCSRSNQQYFIDKCNKRLKI